MKAKGLIGVLSLMAVCLQAFDVRADEPPRFFDALLEKGTSRYSQGKEELIIRHFFRDRNNGFYVDVGCYLPNVESTTHYLEKELGWHGIGVDAEESYRAAWRKFRPRSEFFAYAVTEKSGETISFYAVGPIASVEKSKVESWLEELKVDLDPKEVVVPTITIDDLLDRQHVMKIDFLSIDINGMEPAALSKFSIRRFRPDLVHVALDSEREEELMAYFEKNGYRRIDAYLKYDTANWYFTPKDSAEGAGGNDDASK